MSVFFAHVYFIHLLILFIPLLLPVGTERGVGDGSNY